MFLSSAQRKYWQSEDRSACAQYEYLVALNAYPSRKYEGAAYHDIAAALERCRVVHRFS
jgi:hypothetical protein